MKKPLLTLALIFLAGAFGVYLSRGVWNAYREQRATADEGVRSMRESEENRARLLREESRLKTPAGREQQVRDRGWMKDGEVPVER